ncbi:hypothetical protein [Kribbella yunnanensis]|uniref:hypothetical protein n=1 Tax=Kribbella yunnanensis TaxID=190194 RepID=UPI0031D3732D
MVTRGTPVVDALEAFYAMSIEDLSGELDRGLTAARALDLSTEEVLARLRCGDFLATYLEQVQSGTVESWLGSLDLEAGVLRASLVGRELAETHAHRRRSMLIDGEHLSNERLPHAGVGSAELKAALCYAHDILLEDPFDEEQVLADFAASVHEVMPETTITIAPDPEHFVDTVRGLLPLAPLARDGVLAFAPRRLAMDARLAGVFASNAWDLGSGSPETLASSELARRSLRLWLASGGRYVPLFGSDSEEAAFASESGLFAEEILTQELARLRRIATLSLPSAGRLSPQQMLDLRRADMFEEFRTRQRQALQSVGPGTDAETAGLFREEMKVAADELGAHVRKKDALVTAMPKYLNWGVGAIGLTIHDWRLIATGLGGITVEVLAERFLGREGLGKRALVHHYATLAAR